MNSKNVPTKERIPKCKSQTSKSENFSKKDL